MSLAEAVGWTLLRGVLIALLAVAIAGRFGRAIEVARASLRRLLWGTLLLTYFTPVLLVGYAYSRFSMSLVHFPVANEILYSLLLLFRFTPVAVVLLRFAPPPPLSTEALHTARLALTAGRGRFHRKTAWCGFWWRGPLRASLPAFSLVFLLVFQEFEMASLMGVTVGTFHTPASWTVWLFDAQVGGLQLDESLRLARLPMFCEAAILLPTLLVVVGGHRLPAQSTTPGRTISRGESRALTGFSVVGIFAVLLLPGAVVVRGTIDGASLLLRNSQFLREIVTSLLLAILCGTAATIAAAGLLHVSRIGRLRSAGIAAGSLAALPGLAGALILGLAAVACFQQTGLNALYDTPVPFLATMFLFLWPRAVLLQLLMHAAARGEPAHVARMMSDSPVQIQRDAARELRWVMANRAHVWAGILVCFWAYWDLTLSSLLLPPGMVAAPVRLYNLMHYGQSAVQSAMLLLALAIPLLLLLAAAGIRRPLLRRLIR